MKNFVIGFSMALIGLLMFASFVTWSVDISQLHPFLRGVMFSISVFLGAGYSSSKN